MSIDLLYACAEQQKVLFYENFLNTGKVGEILCVQSGEEDTVLFERWQFENRGFIVAFVLKSEDSLITSGIGYAYRPIDEFVAERDQVNQKRYAAIVELITSQNMTIDQAKERAVKAGQDPRMFEYRPTSRDDLEERLPPGKKTIQGDRRSSILLCERQIDMKSNMQRPALNVYNVCTPPVVLELANLSTDEERSAWFEKHTTMSPTMVDLPCRLPFLTQPVVIVPIIYTFPENEIDVEKETGLK